jgi:hypothetical protein
MIEASQRMINEQDNSSIVNKYFKLQIKTLLQNALRDPDKLQQQPLQSKEERKKDERLCTYKRDIERLVTETEMLKVVLYLVCRNNNRRQDYRSSSTLSARVNSRPAKGNTAFQYLSSCSLTFQF